MTTRDAPRALFLNTVNLQVVWYRCAMPAMVLGCDWAAIEGNPDQLRARVGHGRRLGGFGDLFDYDVVVLGQVFQDGWSEGIARLREAGVRVLYEIDDYLPGIRDVRPDDAVAWEPRIAGAERAMAACDGLICSTEWLAATYGEFNPRTWVCPNGIDLPRYRLTRRDRPYVTIGWAGASGHIDAAAPWMRELIDVLRAVPRTRFVSVGEPFAEVVGRHVGQERCIAVPFTHLETYPAAMTLFDLALAPALDTTFFRGKSDLRWLEASALGIPVIADPLVYPEVEDGVTGFHATTAERAGRLMRRLIGDKALRDRVGAAARAYVTEKRSAQAMGERWARALREVVA